LDSSAASSSRVHRGPAGQTAPSFPAGIEADEPQRSDRCLPAVAAVLEEHRVQGAAGGAAAEPVHLLSVLFCGDGRLLY